MATPARKAVMWLPVLEWAQDERDGRGGGAGTSHGSKAGNPQPLESHILQAWSLPAVAPRALLGLALLLVSLAALVGSWMHRMSAEGDDRVHAAVPLAPAAAVQALQFINTRGPVNRREADDERDGDGATAAAACSNAIDLQCSWEAFLRTSIDSMAERASHVLQQQQQKEEEEDSWHKLARFRGAWGSRRRRLQERARPVREYVAAVYGTSVHELVRGLPPRSCCSAPPSLPACWLLVLLLTGALGVRPPVPRAGAGDGRPRGPRLLPLAGGVLVPLPHGGLPHRGGRPRREAPLVDVHRLCYRLPGAGNTAADGRAVRDALLLAVADGQLRS
eukprot:scaffold269_cov404-Prasinococcus_capsulatus_cf.AAC.11